VRRWYHSLRPGMKETAPPLTVELDIASRYDMLEMVQTVLGHLAGLAGFDEDACHYMNVAVRESVINAIKHGNRQDVAKRVAVAFTFEPRVMEVRVQDQGSGFNPEDVPDPVAKENLLKATGRGIFFMRSFMDEVSYTFPARGGTVVRMVKRFPDGHA
jgi:serine/threonine-protein kinase RsbW